MRSWLSRLFGLEANTNRRSPAKRVSRSLNLTPLEDRLVPAVTVGVVGGDLIVNGDGSNDQVQISQVSTGVTRIEGLNGTPINGHFVAVQMSFSNNLRVDLGNGNNFLYMPQTAVRDGVVANSAVIKTGTGNDSIEIFQLTLRNDLTVDTGEGDDGVYLNYVIAADDVHLGGDDGINVLTRGGSDFVQIYNSTSNGDVEVNLDDPPGYPGTPGNDTLYMDNVHAVGNFWIYGFGGDDNFYLNNISANNKLLVDMGEGNNGLHLTNSSAGTIETDGGSGHDTVYYSGDAFNRWDHHGIDGFIQL
jgi:hypothetical protein